MEVDTLSNLYGTHRDHMGSGVALPMIDYIRKDYDSCKPRALAETIGMVIAIGVSVLLALTTPHVPMIPAYIGWTIASVLLGVCSWHRGSFGLAATYAAFLVIDTYGLLRTLGVL